MCNDSHLQEENNKVIAVGEPTENAIVNAGIENNILKTNLENEMNKIR